MESIIDPKLKDELLELKSQKLFRYVTKVKNLSLVLDTSRGRNQTLQSTSQLLVSSPKELIGNRNPLDRLSLILDHPLALPMDHKEPR